MAVLFAPLTGMTVMHPRVEGSVLCLSVRLTINLTALPIEKVVSRLQGSCVPADSASKASHLSSPRPLTDSCVCVYVGTCSSSAR